MKFHTTISQNGKTATGIRVPDEVMTALGSGRRPPIRVTLNGYSYRTTVGSVDGAAMFGVSAEVRKNAGVFGGDEVPGSSPHVPARRWPLASASRGTMTSSCWSMHEEDP